MSKSENRSLFSLFAFPPFRISSLMDPIQASKKEQPIDVVEPQPVVVSEQAPTPEISPVVEVGGEVAEGVAEVTEVTKVTEVEKQEKKQEEPIVVAEQVPLPPPPPPPLPVRPAPSKKTTDRLTDEIEEILEEDLKDLYLSMPKEKQAEFKIKGEETMSLVNQLVRTAHVNAKKIFQLIRAWLKIIPGVNRFFLEQEAKIKTDKILLVSEEEKKRGSKL